MTMLDEFLPEHQFRERHRCAVAAAPAAVLDATARFDPAADPLFRRLIALREAPARVAARMRGGTVEARRPFGLQDFTLLGRDEAELVYGLVGRFWRLDFGLEPIADGAAFRAFAAPGVPKLALGFRAVAEGAGRSALVTETRVFCPDRAARLRFAPYWALVRPASGLIRRRMLGAIRRASEAG